MQVKVALYQVVDAGEELHNYLTGWLQVITSSSTYAYKS
jgi:hypothetical protein